MNGKKNARVREKLLLPPACPHFNGRKTAGPIVAVEYVRRLTQPAEQGNRGARKKSEPLEIICFAVNLTPLEIERRINQVGRRFECIALPDAHEWTFSAPFNFQIIYECAVKKGPIDLIVERRDEKRICALCVQGLGQRTGNIGQA